MSKMSDGKLSICRRSGPCQLVEEEIHVPQNFCRLKWRAEEVSDSHRKRLYIRQKSAVSNIQTLPISSTAAAAFKSNSDIDQAVSRLASEARMAA